MLHLKEKCFSKKTVILLESFETLDCIFRRLEQIYKQPACYAVVIDDQENPGQLSGFALSMLHFSTWTGKYGIYLEDLYVRESKRGLGMGKALLEHLAQICVKKGYARFEWWVLDWNTPAWDFYLATERTSLMLTHWTACRS